MTESKEVFELICQTTAEVQIGKQANKGLASSATKKKVCVTAIRNAGNKSKIHPALVAWAESI